MARKGSNINDFTPQQTAAITLLVTDALKQAASRTPSDPLCQGTLAETRIAFAEHLKALRDFNALTFWLLLKGK